MMMLVAAASSASSGRTILKQIVVESRDLSRIDRMIRKVLKYERREFQQLLLDQNIRVDGKLLVKKSREVLQMAQEKSIIEIKRFSRGEEAEDILMVERLELNGVEKLEEGNNKQRYLLSFWFQRITKSNC
ncbi:MAG: hypothetical protein MHMPM18_002243 [Marteilia pararefringens]